MKQKDRKKLEAILNNKKYPWNDPDVKTVPRYCSRCGYKITNWDSCGPLACPNCDTTTYPSSGSQYKNEWELKYDPKTGKRY